MQADCVTEIDKPLWPRQWRSDRDGAALIDVVVWTRLVQPPRRSLGYHHVRDAILGMRIPGN